MGSLTRAFNWEITPLGAPEAWPQSLRVAVSLLLNSRFPMFIWWGEERITLYNDAYKVILGEKHPALGKRGEDVWKEIWDVVGPLADRVMNEGESTWAEDQLLNINRQGFIEEAYFTFSYSPLFDEMGKITGVFCACTETTEKVLATKRIKRSEENLRNFILQAPVAMCILRGPQFIVEIANDKMYALWGREREMLEKRSIFSGLPEAQHQGFEELLTEVLTSGETYTAYGVPINLPRGESIETIFINLTYEALRETDGSISGLMAVAVDVTHQALNQQKIEESAQEVSAVIESAPFPIGVYTGREMRVRMANQSLMDVWGKGNDIVGKLYAEVLPELKETPILGQLDEVYTSGKPYHAKNQKVDLVIEGKLQSFYFNYSFTPLFDKDGNVYGVMNTAADVTDLNEAIQKVVEAEDKAKLAIDSAKLGPFDFDYYKNELYTSPRFEEIVGWGNDSNLDSYVSLILPEDQPIRLMAHDVAMKTGNLDYEVRIKFKKDEVRWIHTGGKVLFNDDGSPKRLIGIVQDLTEEKRFAEELERQVSERTVALELAKSTLQHSYQYLQAILDKFETALASLIPIYEGDKIVDFTFKMTNKAYSAYSNLSPEQIQGKRVKDVFPQYQETEAFERYVKTFETGEAQKWDIHYNVDGLNVYFEVSCSRMEDEVVVQLLDYTNLKSLQIDLIKNIEELQRSNKNLEDFAYAASHDLKEPIRKINFYSDRLKTEMEGKLDERQLGNLNKLQNATMRMYSLVDDLLSYSQVSVRPREQEEVDLNELIKTIQYDLELDIIESGAQFRIGKLPVIKGYARQMQQLFQNLLSNAIKYRKRDESLQVDISSQIKRGSETGQTLTSQEMNKNYHHIIVKDNGIGFDSENFERIFDVFQRLHNAESRGTGVGLSIARKVAQNHNGFIWATGEVGVGATFNLLLPTE